MTRLWRPWLVVLVLAPFLGESLSGATPPLQLILPWNFVLEAGLYGTGALLCREFARRFGLGFGGLCFLGAAYGVFEEALVDRFWFSTTFWKDVDVGSYSEVWHTNVLLALHLTVFHTAVSICSSVLIVERIFPTHRHRAWVERRGLVAAAVTLAVLEPLVFSGFAAPGVLVLVAAAALCLLLVTVAFLVPRQRNRPFGPRRRGLGVVAFLCTGSHFLLVYTVPSTSIPWPAGVAIALAPVVVGAFVIFRLAASDPYGPEGFRVVGGMLTFFIALDMTIGLGGRLDLTAGGVALAIGLRRLRQQAVVERTTR